MLNFMDLKLFLLWNGVYIDVIPEVASAGDDIGVVDRDDQSDKWEQKTGVVVGVGSLS